MSELPGNRLKESVSVPSPLNEGEPSQDRINVCGVDLHWDTQAGTCLFSNIPVAMMWVDSTLAGLMSGVAAMVGPERFSLALQSEGRKSVESDWLMISRHADFREGFAALHEVAAVAGWGDWQLITYDHEKKICIFRVFNNWEALYQRALGVNWGSGMLAGKFAGLCSKLFGTNCWATQTTFAAKGDTYDEFVVTPSTRKIEEEVERLLESDQATRADMAVALELLRQKERMLTDQVKDRVKTEDQFRFMLETSPIAVAIFTFGDYKILFTNQQYKELLDLKGALAGTAHPKAFFTEPEEFDSIVRRLHAGENLTNTLVRLSSFSGSEKWAQAAFFKIKFQGVDCVLSWFFDVTEMRRSREVAEEAAVLKASFLANMSHEIRTPMNAIIGLSQLALRPETHEVDRVVSLRKILSASKSLLHILNDILDFSKVEAGKVTIERTPFSLKSLVEQLQALYSVNAREKGLNFDVNVAADVPGVLMGDSHRINQILSNLLSNAVKFTERGTVTFSVRLKSLESSRATILFSVQDTGVGIPREKQGHLFQAFNQLDASATRRFGGSGLGLAISRKLLALMDSDFRVDSIVGRGSTFSFEILFDLPFGMESGLTGMPSNFGVVGSDLRLAGKHILVAEDESFNQEVVGQFLKLSGATVELVASGKAVLEALASRHFDAVLMDMHMPDMGGIDATFAIRRDPKFVGIPVLALTAAVTPGDRERCYGAGMNDFIPKPIDPDELINKLVYWTNPERKSEFSAAREGGGQGKVAGVGVPGEQKQHFVEPKALQGELPKENRGAELKGFDLTNLRRIMNDERAMIHLLKRFHNHNIDTLLQIKTAVDSRQFDAAHRLVHRLKGTAGNLGAMRLHAAATQLDFELKQTGVLDATWGEFEAAFTDALNQIAHLG